MKLYFNYEHQREYDFDEMVSDILLDNADSGYPLFRHFLDFISIDTEDFIRTLYDESASEIRFLTKLEGFVNDNLREMLDEIANRLNLKFSVNFSTRFYEMLLIKRSQDHRISTGHDDGEPQFPAATGFAIFRIRQRIDHFSKNSEPLPLNVFLELCETVIVQCMEASRIPAQSFNSIQKSIATLDLKNIIKIMQSSSFKNSDHASKREVEKMHQRRIYDITKINSDYIASYECEQMGDLIIASMYEIVKGGNIIKKCPNCNRYFVPLTRSDAIYCDRFVDPEKTRTCKDVGADRVYQAKIGSNKALKLCRNIYMAKQMLVSRNKGAAAHDSYKASLDAFNEESAKWKSKLKSITDENERSLEEKKFIERLNIWKSRGKTWKGDDANGQH